MRGGESLGRNFHGKPFSEREPASSVKNDLTTEMRHIGVIGTALKQIVYFLTYQE